MDRVKKQGHRLLVGIIGTICFMLLLIHPVHGQTEGAEEPVPSHSGNATIGQLINAPARQFGQSRESVIRALQEPLHIATVEFPNIYNPDVMDRIYKLVYKGVEVEIYAVPQTGTEFLWSVALTRDMPEITYGIHMGDAPEAIEGLLGMPEERTTETCTYRYGESNNSGTDTLTFTFEKKSLVEICWEYFLD